MKEIYCAMTRSVLEYSSVVYHSHLNIGQSNELERIQNRSLRAIYGYEHQYEDLLKISGLNMLKDRHIKAFEKFASSTVKNQKYAHWFPLKNMPRVTRSTAQYREDKAIGNRLFNSPIYAMRRCLNNTEIPEIVDLTGLFNCP